MNWIGWPNEGASDGSPTNNKKRARSPEPDSGRRTRARLASSSINPRGVDEILHFHPTIGNVRGNTSKIGVVQFLGLQYATLRDRFAPPQIRQYDPDECIDGTKLGPQIVHIPNGPEVEQSLIQHLLPSSAAQLTASDVDGLNLNLTVPVASNERSRADTKLPVFVYIHGGGFQSGSAAWAHYDLANFVKLSEATGKPCIGVAMNYRLGAPGLLTSQELRDKGYKANNSLLDQRAALGWIKQHIEGFGGDSDNITVAGPVSCSFHLQSREPLFRRVIITSVTSLQMRPISLCAAESSYDAAMLALGLHAVQREKRVRQLVSMDMQALRSGLAGVPLAPTVDDDLPLDVHTFADVQCGNARVAGRHWCESVLIGDCKFDGSIFGLRLAKRKTSIADAFRRSIRRSLSYKAHAAESFLVAYNLLGDVSDDDAYERILHIASDLAFYAATVAVSEQLHADVKMFVYRFNEPNPFPGQWQGYATHGLDVAFLLQNFNHALQEPQRSLAERLASDVFSFVHGEEPWSQWHCDTKQAAVFGPPGVRAVRKDEAAQVERRGIIWQLAAEADLDTLLGAFMAFVQNKDAPQSTLPVKSSLKPVAQSSKSTADTFVMDNPAVNKSAADMLPEGALTVDTLAGDTSSVDSLMESIHLQGKVVEIRNELKVTQSRADNLRQQLVEALLKQLEAVKAEIERAKQVSC